MELADKLLSNRIHSTSNDSMTGAQDDTPILRKVEITYLFACCHSPEMSSRGRGKSSGSFLTSSRVPA